jgi:DtxR family Mn-dependent transcriptional regulator
MGQPIYPILLIGLVFLVLVFLFLPRVGILAALKRRSVRKERERIEDSLKHLLDLKWQNQPGSHERLSANLKINAKAAFQLITAMETQGLVQSKNNQLSLTQPGELWAMQITRAHRLWERYLADEARMPLNQIHGEAHRREHFMTPAMLDELDASMGYPSHDPHGDPIPDRSGKLSEPLAMPLTDWDALTPAKIVHLEDEPPLAYAQILAEGLQLGQNIRILQVTPARITLTDGENEYRLAPAVAANVYVAAIPVEEMERKSAIPLGDLPPKTEGEIVALDESCQGFTRRRFMDLGLTPGIIYPELLNSFGDPRAYRVRGTLIALRKDQASSIWVKPLGLIG